MISEEKFLEKVSELMEVTREDAMITARALVDSGTIDLQKFEDNYLLPKTFMVAYSTRMRHQWSPFRGGYRDLIKKMERAI